MIDIETVIGIRVNTSVDVNGLLVPASSLSEHLRRFSESGLFHSTGFKPYDLSKSGSLSKIKVRDRYFVLSTAHQFRKADYSYEQLCLSGTAEGSFVSSHRAVFVDGLEREEDLDCIIFEFSDSVLNGKVHRSGWYDLTSELNKDLLEKPNRVIAIGYPSYRNNIDYEKSICPVAPNAIWGEEHRSSIKGSLAFKPLEPIDYDPAGMSGAPVFGLIVDPQNPRIVFAGIVLTAGRDRIHFLSRTRLNKMIKTALDD